MSTVLRRRALVAVCGVLAAGLGAFALCATLDAAPGDVMLGTDSVDLSALDAVPAASWEALSKKRVWFGHQSVGNDILAGIEEIRRRRPEVRVEIAEAAEPSRLAGPALAHGRVGTNGDAASKIRDFAQRIEACAPGGVDVALMKLCYVDVVAGTRAEELFSGYARTVERLERKFPGTTFVHVTVPLTAPQAGVKATLKRLAGRLPGGYEDNRARAEFNGMMRAQFKGVRPLVDLAAAESTLPDGTAASLRIGTDAFPCLARCYTTDGGHLNAAGRLVAAREMLLVLTSLTR